MSRQALCAHEDGRNERGKVLGRWEGPNVVCAGHGREQQEEAEQATKIFRICDWQIMVRLPEARVGRMMGCECEEAWYSTTRRNNRFLTSIVVAARW